MQKIAKGFFGIALLLMQGNLFAQKQLNVDATNKTTLIVDVQIIDGTGALPVQGAVRFKGDKIVAIGNLKPAKNELIINGNGLTLAPGFIDAHSHHLGDLQRNPTGLSTSNQGITTVVIGQDGEGYPMDSLEKDMRGFFTLFV